MLLRTLPPSRIHRRQAIALLATCLGGLFVSRSAFADDSFGIDIDGHSVHKLGTPETHYVVAIFVATDCPISNRYLPLLARLSRQFAPRGVRFWLIYPNPGDTLAVVRAHLKQYPVAASLPQLVAPDPRFLAHAHVHVTPEAAIFQRDAMHQPALWHGRIDDRYLTFGTQRPAATHHDLADAIDAALAGRQPAPPAAPPIGCAILPSA